MWALLLLLAATASAQSPVCHALAMEGGGDKGAYEAGVLKAFVKYLNPEDIKYDVVTGISVGSLNAMLVVNSYIGGEAELADRMVALWEWVGQTGSGAVFEDWNSLGIPYAILGEPSLYSTQPLRDTVITQFNDTIGIQRKFVIGTSDFNKGVFTQFNESIGVPGLKEVVMCSSAMPALFPYQNFSGTLFCDGGCIINLNVAAAVDRCLEVTTQENIILDMIFLTGANLEPNATAYKTYEVMNRAKEISSYDNSMWYLYNALQAYPDVNFRYTVVPSQALPGSPIPLVFNTNAVNTMLTLADSDVKALVDGANGKTANDYVNAYLQKRNSRRFK